MHSTKRSVSSPFTTQLMEQIDPALVEDVLRLERECFAPDWHDGEEREFYTEALSASSSIAVFLLDGPRRVGFALAVSHGSALEYLREHDPEVGADPDLLYLETIQVHPDCQGRGGGRLLMEAVLGEVAVRGASRLAMHARVSNGFNRLPRGIPGVRIHVARSIPSWKWGGGEPYEYLEVSCPPEASGDADRSAGIGDGEEWD